MDDVVFPPPELNIISLNCWGLKFLSAQRRERLAEIGRRLATATPPPHVVGLQECWTQEDYLSIRRATRTALPYGKFYHSGAFGGGLAILSRWPIEESSMARYALGGRPAAFYRGDWFVGKGVACATVRFGPRDRDVVEVFNTHTHAPYGEEPLPRAYACHRAAQVWELARLVRGAAERGRLVVAMGDFNMTPLSLPHRILTGRAPVRDAWRVLHPDSALGPAALPAERARRRPIPTAAFNLAENGVTSDSVYCTWRWPPAERRRLGRGKPHVSDPSIDTPCPRGKRLDYIFVGGDDGGRAWTVARVTVGMVDRHPELGCSLSDHFSVEATLVFGQGDNTADEDGGSGGDKREEHHATNIPRTMTTKPDPTGTNSNSTTSPRHLLPLQHDTDATAAAYQNNRRATADSPVPSSSFDNDADPDAEEALHNGTYLQSPTGSEYRGSPSPDADRERDHEPQHTHTHTRTRTRTLTLTKNRPTATTTRKAAPDSGLPPSTYDEILRLIQTEKSQVRRARLWGGRRFLALVVVAVACHVGVWFAPHNYVSFILMLVSTLGLAAGVVDGLIALLGGGWEIRALKEFEWEVRNARAADGGAGGGAMVLEEAMRMRGGETEGEDDEGGRRRKRTSGW